MTNRQHRRRQRRHRNTEPADGGTFMGVPVTETSQHEMVCPCCDETYRFSGGALLRCMAWANENGVTDITPEDVARFEEPS